MRLFFPYFVTLAAALSVSACTRSTAQSSEAPVEPVAIADAGAQATPLAQSSAKKPPMDDVPNAEDRARDPGLPHGVTNRDVDDVREATFKYMFGKNASAMQQGAGVYCLSFDNDKDPPPEFIARFSTSHVSVKPGTSCSASADKGVIDKSSGKSGLIFRIESIHWTDADHADADGGYYEAGLSSSGNTYTLVRANGRWTVTKDVMHWIS